MTEIRYCLCGLSLWATAETADPAAWNRHLAHVAAFQEETRQSLLAAGFTGDDPAIVQIREWNAAARQRAGIP